MSRRAYLQDNIPVNKILEEKETISFTDFTCNCGGDIYIYRVYGNNINNYKIVEK